MNPFVILNPHADRGRCLRLLAPLRSLLRQTGGAEVVLTKEAGDEIRLTREAIAAGHKTIVAVGGDGTWNNVGGEIFRSGTDARLGLVPGGTGSDLAMTLGVPRRDLAACVRIVREGRTRAIDVGFVDGRPFLNIAGFGYDTAVIIDSRGRRFWKGRLVYLLSALSRLRAYQGFDLRMIAEGRDSGKRTAFMLIVANARHFGGYFRIAPAADPADGLLDAVLFENGSLGRRLRVMKMLMAGTHPQAREVTVTRARSFRLTFAEAPFFEVDGELYRAENKDVEIAVVPGALNVLVPARPG